MIKQLTVGLLLVASTAFAGSYDLPAFTYSADQDAAVVRIAVRQCQKGDTVPGLTPGSCTGTPTKAGLETVLSKRLANVVDSEVLQFVDDKAKRAAIAYTKLPPSSQAVIDAEVAKVP